MMACCTHRARRRRADLRKILKDRMTAISETLGRFEVRLGLEFLGPLHSARATRTSSSGAWTKRWSSARSAVHRSV